MKVIAVDDERLLLEDFVYQLEAMEEIKEVNGFTDEEDAIEYCSKNKVDVAFLDVQMKGMGGIVLAKKLKEIQKEINIIFLTGYPEYALDAMKLHASGYLVKPPVDEEIIAELNNLRRPVEEGTKLRIRILTFGSFDVYVDGKLLDFKRAKSKEVLAYLVNKKGASATRKELAAVLFDGKEYSRSVQQQLQVILSELNNTLQRFDAEGLLVKGNNTYLVDTNQFSCDYYEFLDGDEEAIRAYDDHYMDDYSWGEETNARLMLDKMKES